MEAAGPEGKQEENGIYIVIESAGKTQKLKYKKKAVKILSLLHVISGILAISVACFMFLLKSGYQRNEEPFNTVGEGLFCGVMFTVTGVLGISTIKKTTYCKISAFLVLSILSSLSGFIMILLSLATMTWSLHKDYTPAIVCHCLLIICGMFEFILSIVSSSYSCHACCGCCGGTDSEPGLGANSVVYCVPTQGEPGDTNQPRVVRLNMQELQRTAQTERQAPVISEKESQDKDEMEQKNCRGYSRFS